MKISTSVVAAATSALAAFLAAGAIPLAVAVATASADAPSVVLHGHLEPNRLGASTTVSISFQVGAGSQDASPLRSFSVSLPQGMGFASTMLGLATCSEPTLLRRGPTACPVESLMGYGAAEVQAPFGAEVVREGTRASIFMTQSIRGHTAMLFYLDALTPLIAAVVLPAQVVTLAGTSDTTLAAEIPEIATYPDAPPISVLSMRTSIGPSGIRYFKRVHGRRVAYRPRGLSVPERCPKGGFVFVGRFKFQDGSQATAKSVVPCPRRRADASRSPVKWRS